jgi:hypothetical protein
MSLVILCRLLALAASCRSSREERNSRRTEDTARVDAEQNGTYCKSAGERRSKGFMITGAKLD